ncbi:DUF72 domain-containing protein [candidate division KSB1 bacterium]|nr:DUF72 domain-containing protein [candidate division KSB1 bacterium]NIV69013.1 DUF72 domain-containing protein [Phycisphaerae bacterium]NIR69012.1 DUF72 domain-containing protein [candidate division KSB1 bacterium]NIS24084.1 DUF72 domain-containing protein [candidate division KSB1 bacterium]NIT71003.1 DUF72 domain-containing protein [candidate division KSB1 bacterium]
MTSKNMFIGCAGWQLPKDIQNEFPAEGTHLQRYAKRFPAVEINSTFRKSHRPSTYSKWADSVPDDFKFAVKIPRKISHDTALSEIEPVHDFLAEIAELGDKMGPLLLQLPPTLAFEKTVADDFFGAFRKAFDGQIVCEPRHESWFFKSVDQMLAAHQVARVAADPAPVDSGDEPGGWQGVVYYRLHGSPRKYYSAYSEQALKKFADAITKSAESAETWCLFDNTAAGAGTGNALALLEMSRED